MSRILASGAAAASFSTSAGGTASPARLIVRNQDGKVPARTSSATPEGAPQIVVTSPAGRPGSASRFSTTTSRPPQERGAKISNTETSKPIEVAPSTPARSSGGKASRAQYISATGLRCSTATALGRPVEPEV